MQAEHEIPLSGMLIKKGTYRLVHTDTGENGGTGLGTVGTKIVFASNDCVGMGACANNDEALMAISVQDRIIGDGVNNTISDKQSNGDGNADTSVVQCAEDRGCTVQM